mmetsp:Transcript_20717/g.57253  ORF Transcript_20717/g.57253 Transcript_20717/m.57253 type:complete len:81 (+) Transcript_20717:1100-1342(+)
MAGQAGPWRSPDLFHGGRPQWAEQQCSMPKWTDPKKQRRKQLRALCSAAKMACAGVVDEDLCVQDIENSGDLGMAKTFKY